ncbi:hypothetical protein DVH05_000139 [Phytophthora capsici]|nr:hypothetical protein DVH05_006520 [Phytophthora capsici]KAG1712391.1 hypothetical protein DVH05_000139 [Phytophthora capsici]
MTITDGTTVSAAPTKDMTATTATTTGTVPVIAEMAGATADATVETDPDATEVTAVDDEAATSAHVLTPMLSTTAVLNSASSTATVEVPRMTGTGNQSTTSTAGDTTAETTTTTVTFKNAWKELRRAGWFAKPPRRGLDVLYRYVRPGGSADEVQGGDYFLGEQDLVALFNKTHAVRSINAVTALPSEQALPATRPMDGHNKGGFPSSPGAVQRASMSAVCGVDEQVTASVPVIGIETGIISYLAVVKM